MSSSSDLHTTVENVDITREGGCDPHRDPATAIRAVGFAAVTVEDRKFKRSPFWPVNTAVWGIATR